MEKKKLVPELRFPDFKNNWSTNTLGSIATFSKGKGISKADINEKGELACIRYGELYTRYAEIIDEVVSRTNVNASNLVLSEANDVIIPASGETKIDIATASCVLHGGIALGGDLNIVKSKGSGVFLAYYLNNARKKDIAGLAQGISVVHLYANQLKNLTIHLPDPEEQQKIASFLTAVDRRIQLLQKKKAKLEEYKKGVMQKLFTQEIRFKDENGKDFPDWEEKRLGDVVKLQGGYAFKSTQFQKEGIPVIRISNISNENNHIDLKSLVYYRKIKNEENFTLKYGDLIIAMSGATTGKSGIFNLPEKAYINQRVGLFKSIDKDLIYSFLVQFVWSKIFINQLDSLLVAGAQPNISSKDIESLSIPYPESEEQKKVAAFLSSLDRKIEQVGLQIKKTQAWKKGLLQKMFV